ncbi:hypothetical protein C5167_001706 [Papaver somniferum]|uniref:Uncharacterized protein n=1 Tax=Papaver somniferum TaxID=3469 RepID=A0A4Y7KTF5_PAPSO|nr:hypothetical protein C5167_001706 [Papaver somniferum]
MQLMLLKAPSGIANELNRVVVILQRMDYEREQDTNASANKRREAWKAGIGLVPVQVEEEIGI